MTNKSPSLLRRKEKTQEVWDFLNKKFPNFFLDENKKRLVSNQAFKLSPFLNSIALESGFSKESIKIALYVYFSSAAYLKAIIHETHYYNFHGEKVGVIELHHKQHAQKMLDKRFKKRAKI